jgi:glycosyltransferase involved in cell wall biosynthesis
MKVSVIIPDYNAERFLSTTLESILMQEELGEVLLTNDASTYLIILHLEETGLSKIKNSRLVYGDFFTMIQKV